METMGKQNPDAFFVKFVSNGRKVVNNVQKTVKIVRKKPKIRKK